MIEKVGGGLRYEKRKQEGQKIRCLQENVNSF